MRCSWAIPGPWAELTAQGGSACRRLGARWRGKRRCMPGGGWPKRMLNANASQGGALEWIEGAGVYFSSCDRLLPACWGGATKTLASGIPRDAVKGWIRWCGMTASPRPSMWDSGGLPGGADDPWSNGNFADVLSESVADGGREVVRDGAILFDHFVTRHRDGYLSSPPLLNLRVR